MMPSKNFNLILPFATYRELKQLSIKNEKPIAELVRRGIDLVLKNSKSEKPANLIEEIGNEKR